MSNSTTCDVLVIGAGIAGAGAAYYLGAQQGIDSILVERDSPASGPTGASSAVCHLFYTEAAMSRLAKRGCQILKELPERIGSPVVFHENGCLWVAGENNVALWTNTVARIRDVEGGTIETLTPEEVARIAPNFNTEGIAVGIWEEGYGYADPYDATNELVRGAREQGCRYLGNRSVTALRVESGKIRGVELSDGTRISTERVIMTAGPWTKALVSPLGVDLPLHIERHFMAVLDAPGRAKDVLPFCWVDDTTCHYARPEGENTILIGTWDGGGTGERNDDVADQQDSHIHEVAVAGEFEATTSTDESIWAMQHMVPRCPDIEGLGIRPGYACMYDMSADQLPVYDEVPGAEGLYFAAGSSGHGFKVGPSVGESMAKWALGEKPDELEPYALSRFD